MLASDAKASSVTEVENKAGPQPTWLELFAIGMVVFVVFSLFLIVLMDAFAPRRDYHNHKPPPIQQRGVKS